MNPEIYEKAVKRENNPSRIMAKILTAIGYVCFELAWIAWIVKSGFNAGLVALAIISTLLLVSFTWKYFQLVYEYSFVGSTLEVSKIYANKHRKECASLEIKDALVIGTAVEENISRIKNREISETIYAISSDKAENIWFILFEDSSTEELKCVFFEADERSLGIIKHYNSQAMRNAAVK